MALSHDDLMNSLADHLGGEARMVWRDMQLGPSGSPRPDVYTICRSFANPTPMAYECKVSRSDFLSDVTAGKWQSYLAYACGVVFACEQGLLKNSDVPQHCGLIVYKHSLLDEPGRWRMPKRAVLNPVIIPQDAFLKLLIDGVKREGPRYRAKYWTDNSDTGVIRKKFGEIVARTVRDRMAVEFEISEAKRHAEYIESDAKQRAEHIVLDGSMKAVEPKRAELCEALGLKADASHWDIQREVTRIRKAAEENPSVAKFRELTQRMGTVLHHYGWREEKPDEEEVDAG